MKEKGPQKRASIREPMICSNLPCFLGHGNTFGSKSGTQPAHRVL
jgi:hypothetical protein